MELPKLDLGSLRSPFAEQLRSGFGGLCFSGLLEKEFREFHTAQSLPRARWSALISLVVVLSIAAFESLAGPTVGLPPGGTVRLFVLCPALALVALAMSVPALRPLYTWIAGGGATVIGLISIYLSQSAALQGAPHVLAGLVIAVLLACLFFGLLFPVAVAVSAVLIAANVLVGLALQLPVNQLSYITAMMTAAAVIGSIWTYKLEHALRTNFLETRLLNELAERDGLTGLYNRRIFDDFVQRLWRQARRDDVAIEFVFIDIDYFKIYNDLYGHQAGDDCLKKVAACIARCAKRPFDFAARYGGDEFMLVLYGPPDDYARTLPEQIRREVEALALPHEGSMVAWHVTLSIGVGFARAGSRRSLAGAIQSADEALYEAKRSGRNRAVFKDANEAAQTGNFRVPQRMQG